MIHVALNLLFLVPGETGGTETAVRDVLPHLAARPGLRITALVNREAAERGGPWRDLVPMVTLPVRGANRAEWVRGEQVDVPRAARAIRADVVHSMGNTAPLHGRFRRVVTIHDLHYRIVPEAHFGMRALGMRVLVPAAARTSHRIITVSDATRRDLVSMLGTPLGKVDVVPHGASTAAPALATPEEELRKRLGLGARPVLLSVSAKRPHKNLMRLIDAVAAIENRPVLVLPGYPTPHEAELRARAAALGIADDVLFPPWMPPEDLEALYALATAFVFPSLYEGFGLPVLEAMARGVPVAASDRGSVPEVAGNAAILFDPEDTRAMRSAIELLLGDRGLTERLRAAGVERARHFSWQRAADETVASYRRAL